MHKGPYAPSMRPSAYTCLRALCDSFAGPNQNDFKGFPPQTPPSQRNRAATRITHAPTRYAHTSMHPSTYILAHTGTCISTHIAHTSRAYIHPQPIIAHMHAYTYSHHAYTCITCPHSACTSTRSPLSRATRICIAHICPSPGTYRR